MLKVMFTVSPGLEGLVERVDHIVIAAAGRDVDTERAVKGNIALPISCAFVT